MFTINKGLSNVRPAKTDKAELSTTSTKGSIKLNDPAATLMGVKKGDYLNVVEGEVAGEKAFYVSKGSKGNGNKMLDSGSSLSFSSASVWQNLGGTEDAKKVYAIDAENAQESEGVTYFKLVEVRTEAKAARKSKEVASAE